MHTASPPLPAEIASGRTAVRGWGSIFRWWRAPFWFLALFTGAKSFADNPILGSRRLNRAGLHVWRLQAAHALARWRRARLARHIPQDLRANFDRDGFILLRDFLPAEDFAVLSKALLDGEFDSRSQQQGDTITRRVPIGAGLRREVPLLDRALRGRRLRALLAYVASARAEPLYYVQTVSGGAAKGPPDPQLQLHADTFHPSLKAWLFLTDVEDDDRPLTYVAGSHRLTERRKQWEYRKSIEVLRAGDRLSQRGSLRLRPDELGSLGLPPPTRFAVPANTLVIVDTCGFHARAESSKQSVRVELWAFCRRNPFLPWTSASPLSWGPIGRRQSEWLNKGLDWLDRAGLHKQHWQAAGRRRPIDA